jgi:antitoxin ParD1/3/4
VHVSLTKTLEELVRKKVASGLYNNASEVVREALRLMAAQDEVNRIKLARLQDALIKGEESGPPQPLDMDEILAELDAESVNRP